LELSNRSVRKRGRVLGGVRKASVNQENSMSSNGLLHLAFALVIVAVSLAYLVPMLALSVLEPASGAYIALR
jgi:hypothetical protein